MDRKARLFPPETQHYSKLKNEISIRVPLKVVKSLRVLLDVHFLFDYKEVTFCSDSTDDRQSWSIKSEGNFALKSGHSWEHQRTSFIVE